MFCLAASACRRVYEVCIDVRSIDLIDRQYFVSGLGGLESVADLSVPLTDLNDKITEMRVRFHHGHLFISYQS